MVTTLVREPAGTSPAGSPASPPPARTAVGSLLLWRARLTAVCLAFVGLALSQAPGRIVADTKLDLVVDPLGFLGRALHLWEPQGFAGQVQNQAYGYLFPMGPFFALGSAAGLPEWVVQRLWMALLLSVAFLGVVVLARRQGIGTPATVLLAGIAYALSPRMLTAVGATSVEVLPMALAPWVLVPLVGATAARSPRRAAALSGLAVLCAGGVNAVAASAVLPLPVLWLLTRPAGPLRRRLTAWWVASVALAVAWWAGPLVLLGRYSPPFLDYIETARITTGPADLLSVLRGTAHWVAALASPSGPLWPAGWALLHDTLPVAATLVLLVAGLLGLVRRDLPERTWLVLGALAGAALATLGHVAPVDGLLAGPLHAALDGPLAPLRNVHKFDPVLRLPLVLGGAHVVAVLLRRARDGRGLRPAGLARLRRDGARAAVVLLALALVGTAAPALDGRLAPPGGFEQIPTYWRQTADFLAGAAPEGRALLVPGSSFGVYAWGRTNDEPLQPLARSPWEVRDAVPLTPPAHIRMLDAIEQRLARGEGSSALTRYLARAGISYVVLRNDLDTGEAGSTRPVLVAQALRDSPGIEPVADFGPDFPGRAPMPGLVYDAGLGDPAPAVQVFAVAGTAPRAWTAPLSDAVTVAGGPDAVLALEDRGVVTDRPTLLAGSTSVATGATMVSDALVRRERFFGRLAGASSAGLAVTDPLRLHTPARDYAVATPGAAESVVQYGGGTPSASSSASDADSASGAEPDASPWAAVDGDPTTAWRPADRLGEPGPVWWRLDTVAPFEAEAVTVRLALAPRRHPPRSLRLTTDAGQVTVPVADTDRPQTLRLPAGPTRSLTIAPAALSSDGGAPALALAEVEIPGVHVSRSVVTPAPTGAADVYAFDASGPTTTGCLTDAAGANRCAAGLVDGAEEPGGIDRVFTVDRRADYDLALTATPRRGPELDALLTSAADDPVQVTASSSVVPDPRGSAAAAVDGRPDTAWLAAPGDRRPTLELRWAQPRTIDSLHVVLTPGLAAALPSTVTIDGGGLTRSLNLGADGRVRFAPMTTDRLLLTFQLPLGLSSFDPSTRSVRPLGVGVSELEVGGASGLAAGPATPVHIPCGDGPVVTLDGRQLRTAADTTIGDLRSLRPVPLTVCPGAAPADLGVGTHRLSTARTGVLTVSAATLTRTGEAPSAAAGRTPAEVGRWDAEHRSVNVAARSEPTLLVVPENVNPGWTATLGGQRLDTVAVDGWQQGYVLPAGGAGTVTLDFGPGTAYRAALGAGAVAVLVLVVLAVLPGHPPRPSAPRHRRRRPGTAVVWAAAVVGTALVGGVVGLGALLVVGAGAGVAGRRGSLLLAGIAGTALGAAGLLLVAAPDGTGTARQVLAVVAVAAVAASVLRRGDPVRS